MSKTLTWQAVAPPAAWRRRLARTLRVTGRALAAWARRLVPPEPAPRPEPVLEFYAEAGAPEGALFIDGQRVGVLPGVTRL
jgi:hypothetical protein